MGTAVPAPIVNTAAISNATGQERDEVAAGLGVDRKLCHPVQKSVAGCVTAGLVIWRQQNSSRQPAGYRHLQWPLRGHGKNLKLVKTQMAPTYDPNAHMAGSRRINRDANFGTVDSYRHLDTRNLGEFPDRNKRLVHMDSVGQHARYIEPNPNYASTIPQSAFKAPSPATPMPAPQRSTLLTGEGS